MNPLSYPGLAQPVLTLMSVHGHTKLAKFAACTPDTTPKLFGQSLLAHSWKTHFKHCLVLLKHTRPAYKPWKTFTSVLA